MPFQYKRILVIGATSGIGYALASRFVKEGSKVIVSGRRKENLEKFVHEHGKDNATAVPFDVAELEKIPAFVKNITSSYPDLDCIFLNSGIQRGINFRDPSSVDLSATFAQELHVNYTSFVHLTHAFLPWCLSQSHEVALLYTTSNLAIVPLWRAPGYSASKAALHAFILCLRAQLLGTNVKVMELLPPAVQTELHNAKNQPDLDDKRRNIGMPLDQFTDQAYESMAQGEETNLINSFSSDIKEVEDKRQAIFWKFYEMMKGQ